MLALYSWLQQNPGGYLYILHDYGKGVSVEIKVKVAHHSWGRALPIYLIARTGWPIFPTAIKVKKCGFKEVLDTVIQNLSGSAGCKVCVYSPNHHQFIAGKDCSQCPISWSCHLTYDTP